MARLAYATETTPVRSDRGAEYDAFSRCTRHLLNARRDRNRNFNALAKALHENLRLWTVVATSVADNDNVLPPALRAQLFYLAEFTKAHSRKVLKKEAGLEPLIEINTAVMRGLRGGVGT